MLIPRAFRFSRLFFAGLMFCLVASFANANTNGNGFIENKGQIVDQFYQSNNDVLYQYAGNGIKIQLRKQGYSYELFKAIDLPKILPGKMVADLKQTKVITHRVDVDFVNANQNISVSGMENTAVVLNYVINGKETYNVGAFKKVVYHNVYDHVDIEFMIDAGKNIPLKYNIILHPGANINDVKLLFKGAEQIVHNSKGEIEIKTSLATVSENIPFSFYQNAPSIDHPVEFELQGNVVSFKTNYDNTKTLVIDPSSNLVWGNYIGGNALDYSTALCISNSFLYETGYTLSTSNIATAGVHQTTLSGGFDSYLVKYNSNGVMQWGTYFGGTDVDAAYSLAADATGNIYVGGDTFSTSNIATGGSHQFGYGGGIDDAMLFKFNSFGQRLWSTYYGGTFHDIIGHLCVDLNNNVLISGHSESSNAIATAGAYQTIYASAYDVFVAKFSPGGVRQWGTYYGDTGADEAWGIDTDQNGDVYVSGFTSSLFSISTPTAHQLTLGGGNNDCFVFKLNAAGNSLVWGTYYGGTGDENGTSVEFANGKVFLVGQTTSSTSIASASAYQTALAGAEDGFLVSFNSNGARLWGTYYGGVDADYVNDLFLDNNNDLMFCGQTLSQSGISTSGAYQVAIADANNYDAFFAKISNAGALMLGTYYGGVEGENSKGIVVDSQGKVYLSGETSSTLGISNASSTSSVYIGAQDAFLAKFCIKNKISVLPATTNTVCFGGSFTLTAPAGCQTYSWSSAQTTSAIVVAYTAAITNYTYLVNVLDGTGCDAYSDTIHVNVLDCSSGISEMSDESSLSIYPNPAANTLFIKNNQQDQGTIKIYDLNGRIVLNTVEAQKPVDISNLPGGMYLFEFKTQEKRTLKKFVKE